MKSIRNNDDFAPADIDPLFTPENQHKNNLFQKLQESNSFEFFSMMKSVIFITFQHSCRFWNRLNNLSNHIRRQHLMEYSYSCI